MGLIFRKSCKLGRGITATLSNSGLSASVKRGPLTASSRGRISLRLGKGFTWRIR